MSEDKSVRFSSGLTHDQNLRRFNQSRKERVNYTEDRINFFGWFVVLVVLCVIGWGLYSVIGLMFLDILEHILGV